MRIGWTELVVILIIALVIFGGGKLAGVGSALGRSVKEFKKEVKNEDIDKSQENDISSTKEN